MLEFVATVAKIGVPAFIGWWIDLALDDPQQRQVRRKLDDWWTKFDEIKWVNFGQQEGLAALLLFDRVFGDQLWSFRRWLSVATILSVTISLVLVGMLVYGKISNQFPSDYYFVIPYACSMLLLQAFSMGLSLSATRWLTNKLLQLKRFASVVGFASLLLLAMLLIVVWMPFQLWIKEIAAETSSEAPSTDLLKELLTGAYSQILELREISFLDRIFPFKWKWIASELKSTMILSSFIQTAISMGSLVADYFVSTIRVLFSAFFLCCLLLRRVVHQPLSRLGFIWLTSGKPIFATLFGAIAAAIVGGHEFVRALERFFG